MSSVQRDNAFNEWQRYIKQRAYRASSRRAFVSPPVPSEREGSNPAGIEKWRLGQGETRTRARRRSERAQQNARVYAHITEPSRGRVG